MNALECIYKRRSIRKFSGAPVEDALIEELLRAAMAAPSAMNLKPWRFVVVRDPERLERLRKVMPFGKMDAGTAISVCGDLRSGRRIVSENFWQQDCSAATENLLIAASALGLGAVWCGVTPLARLQKAVSAVLELPEGVLPLNLVLVGYPAEEKPARTQYDPALVSLDSFGTRWEKGDS